MIETADRAARRHALRQQLLRQRTPAPSRPGRDEIATRPAGSAAPLSHAQERMWFFHQLDPAASAYNVCVLWRLTGTLDPVALRTSFERICERHEVLRTVYPVDSAGVPYQQTVDRLAPEWSQVDLTASSGAGQEAALQDIARAAGRAPFDLARRSPLRLVLARLAERRHALVMVGQHITWDGPAFGVLARELTVTYRDVLERRPETRPPLAVQYADFAAWHRRRWDPAEGADAAEQLAYWRSRLTPLPARTEIPTDAERPPTVGESGGSCTRWLDPAATDRIVAAAASARVTPFMLLIGGIAALLSRYADTDEVTLGTVTPNRDRADLADLIGNFGNTLALRIDLSGHPTFGELLTRVRDACTGAYAHADVPFDRILDDVGAPREAGRSPLFDVTVIFLAQELVVPELPGLEVTWERFHNGTTQLDLSFDAVLTGGRLGIQATYRAALFRDDTVQRLLRRLERLLLRIAAAPDERLSQPDLLLDDERELILGGRARPAQPPDQDTVPALFAAQAARSADRLALVAGPERLTFAELHARVNRLARDLVAHGVGPEVLVGLALPRTADALTAVLAVLAAGGAYLPLDPGYPAEHNARVLADARPGLLLVSGSTAPPGAQHIPVLDLASQVACARIAGRPGGELGDTDRIAPLRAEHPAFVVHTSGSTGAPKGVVIPHAGLVNLFHSHRADLYEPAKARVGRDRLVVGHAWSLSFDASWQPQLWLLDGHCLHLLPYEVYADPQVLAAAVGTERFDFIELTPSLLEQTLRHLTADDLPVPAMLGFGGEAVSPALWTRLGELPGTVAVNLYGPTEATVDSLVMFVTPGTAPAVGHPVAGGRATVLDRALRPVPPGVPGELYLGGAGLARGYLGRPGRTAERFVPDRYGPPGARAYRTGDLVRLRTDGELEFLGRTDDQVKIRGFRVEPGEVEAALRRVAGGHEVAVAVREDRSGHRRLVGYVAAPPDTVDRTAIRRLLAAELPAHLVPSTVLRVDAMPLLPNGKLDRHALPAPEPDRDAARYEPPRGDAETAIARVWAEVLEVTRVSRRDNFFDLGGDSLLGARATFRLREALKRDVALGELFRSQTVAEMAAALADTEPATAPNPDPTASGTTAGTTRPSGGTRPWPSPLPPPVRTTGQHVLVTGATGFLGAHLVRALLADEPRRPRPREVHCLVRAADAETGWRRLRAGLIRHGHDPAALPVAAPPELLRVVPGDLALPRLGLDEQTYGRLAGEIDLIVHAGAWVDALHTADTLAAANVEGTRELLHLAATTRLRPLRFVSTGAAARRGPAPDPSGYVETKWQAEQVVGDAGRHGIPAAVYRVPRLTGDSRTGLGNDRDIMRRLLHWILRLGLAPALDLTEDWIPVDEAARLLLDGGAEAELSGVVTLVAQRPVHLAEIVEVARTMGHRITEVPMPAWLRALAEQAPEQHAVLTAGMRLHGLPTPSAAEPTVTGQAVTGPAVTGLVTARPIDDRVLRAYVLDAARREDT